MTSWLSSNITQNTPKAPARDRIQWIVQNGAREYDGPATQKNRAREGKTDNEARHYRQS